MNATAGADLPSLTGDLEQTKRDHVQWGYCLLCNVIAECKRLLDRLIERADLEGEQGAYMAHGHSPFRGGGPLRAGLEAGLAIGGQPAQQGAAIDLAMNPKLHALSEHTFQNVLFDLSSVRRLIQRTGARDGLLHIDQILVPFPTLVPIPCNLTFALTAYTGVNGATRVVPGSHRLTPPHLGRDGNATPEGALEARPGTAIVREGRTWHRAAADNSDAERIGRCGRHQHAVGPPTGRLRGEPSRSPVRIADARRARLRWVHVHRLQCVWPRFSAIAATRSVGPRSRKPTSGNCGEAWAGFEG